MSIIFSQALNTIKANTDNIKSDVQKTQLVTKRIVLNSNRNDIDSPIANQSSILSRIKLNKDKISIRGIIKKDFNLLSRKANQNEESNLFSLQKKVIKKDLRYRLTQNANTRENQILNNENENVKDDNVDNNNTSENDVWKQDNSYSDEPTKINPSPETSIFIRNLPENISYHFIKGLFKDEEDFISGIKVFYSSENKTILI